MYTAINKYFNKNNSITGKIPFCIIILGITIILLFLYL